jgi:hypothetical protein
MREEVYLVLMLRARSAKIRRKNWKKIFSILLLTLGISLLLLSIYLAISTLPMYLLTLSSSLGDMMIYLGYNLLKDKICYPNGLKFFKVFLFVGVLFAIGFGVYFSVQSNTILVYIFSSSQIALTALIILLCEIEVPYLFRCLVGKRKDNNYERV